MATETYDHEIRGGNKQNHPTWIAIGIGELASNMGACR